MNLRENVKAILHYEDYDQMPIICFGYWHETLDKWADEGHVTREEAEEYRITGDNGEADKSVMKKLGFDFNWNAVYRPRTFIFPPFEREILEKTSEGALIIRDEAGMLIKEIPGVVSIPMQLGTSLTGRDAWEQLYLPRLQYCEERLDISLLDQMAGEEERDVPRGLFLGSLMGEMRNILGVEEMSYLYLDDEELYREIVDTIGGLCYSTAKAVLERCRNFDFAHYWEDICFKNGPLVVPDNFSEYAGKWYRRLSDLVNSYGIDIISVDCDGKIDALLPIWLENGVNTMFPIEVGTWDASIRPWREQYGTQIRGVGGMNKNVFARDKASVDAEIERLRGLIALGGYIPCPDHRIAPDAKFELVQYYCERMRGGGR